MQPPTASLSPPFASMMVTWPAASSSPFDICPHRSSSPALLFEPAFTTTPTVWWLLPPDSPLSSQRSPSKSSLVLASVPPSLNRVHYRPGRHRPKCPASQPTLPPPSSATLAAPDLL
ncbi:hypothetical protein C2845_PM01G37540 [Panicum miliaceum]|uniref:Uncharacterized protein n=1 Tax=Panicum miliaceum TaxID=4540 RepID=A0A3L6TFV6_PANMI|nr:hypothetical protein C2845_PM01G37540 [Panicum miliaceum]